MPSIQTEERVTHTWNHNNTGIRMIEIGTGSVKWRRVEVILFQTRNQRVGVTPLDSPTDHTAYHQLQRGGGHSVTVEENISFVVVIAKESPRERENGKVLITLGRLVLRHKNIGKPTSQGF